MGLTRSRGGFAQARHSTGSRSKACKASGMVAPTLFADGSVCVIFHKLHAAEEASAPGKPVSGSQSARALLLGRHADSRMTSLWIIFPLRILGVVIQVLGVVNLHSPRNPHRTPNPAPALQSVLPGRGVPPFGVSGPHWRKSCLGPHVKYKSTNKN